MYDSPENVVPINEDAQCAARKFSEEHGRELLAILFTDLVDSTQLQSDLGNVEAARITEVHRGIVRDELAMYDAREIEWAGDSCLAVFTKPSEAVAFALRMQAVHRRVRETEPKLPTVRVGIHLGEIVVAKGEQREDLFGLQVSEAARVMSLARGDQIYCTRAVFDNARSSLRGGEIEGVGPVVWLNHGAYALKGSDYPLEICEVGEDGLVPLREPVANEKCRPVALDVDGGSNSKPSRVVPAMIGGLVVVIAILAAMLLRPDSVPEKISVSPVVERESEAIEEPKEVRRWAMSLPPNLPLNYPNVVDTSLALSPDGKLLAYLAYTPDGPRLVIQKIGDLEVNVVAEEYSADRPFFSPDGEWIGFLGQDEDGWHVMRIPASGGTALPIVDVPLNMPASWESDGFIYYTPSFGSGLMRVSAFGGEPEAVTELEEGSNGHTFSILLPGEKGLVYTSFSAPNTEAAHVRVMDLGTGESKILVDKAGGRFYTPSGHLIYGQVGRLMAVKLDPDTLELTGPHFDVTDLRMSDPDETPTRTALSASGTLVYAPSGIDASDSLQMAWRTDAGQEIPLDMPPGVYSDMNISPDGRFVAFVGSQSRNEDIWILDTDRNTKTRFTDHPAAEHSPTWTSDSARLYFESDRGGSWGIYTKPVDGSEELRQIIESPDQPYHIESLSPDDSTLIIAHRGDLYSLDVAEGDAIVPLVQSRFRERFGELSPDGQWLSYSSNESGRREAYVRSYPDMERKFQVSTNGGDYPHWGPEGQLRYVTPGGESSSGELTTMMEVELEYEPAISVKHEREVFTALESSIFRMAQHPDGDRYMVVKLLGQGTVRVGGTQVVVVENWLEELKGLEPLEQP